MKYTVILFDLDYTLGDATEGILFCFRHALAEMGYGAYSDGVIQSTIGHTLEDSFTMVTGCEKAERRETFRGIYRAKADEVMHGALKLYPDVLPLLKKLQERGCRMGVVSTRLTTRLDSMLRQAGARGYFQTLVGVDSVPRAKPDPAGLLLALSHLNGAPEQTLYLGDTVMDAQAAAGAGLDFAGVCIQSKDDSVFAPFPCKTVIANYRQLANFLNISLDEGNHKLLQKALWDKVFKL